MTIWDIGYEFRPIACRKLLVVTDPALCDAVKHPADSFGRWFSWEAEILESAALQNDDATRDEPDAEERGKALTGL